MLGLHRAFLFCVSTASIELFLLDWLDGVVIRHPVASEFVQSKIHETN
jgi:hypothetical protein